MARAYSLDLRERVVKAVDNGMSVEEAVELFEVSKSFIYDMHKRQRDNKPLEPKIKRPGRPAKFAEHKEHLKRLVKEHPDATLEELREKLPFPVSIGALWNALRREGIVLKKSYLRA